MNNLTDKIKTDQAVMAVDELTRTSQAIEKKEWQELKDQLESVIRLFGSMLFTPVILLISLACGLRAGIIAGTEKALEMFRSARGRGGTATKAASWRL